MSDPRSLDAAVQNDLVAAYRSAKSRLILLDYDGTLKSFVDRPEDANPDPELLQLLRRLAAADRTELAIVTGRTRSNMEEWLGAESLGLSTEHGLWIRWPGADWTGMFPQGYSPNVLDPVRDLLQEFTDTVPGSRIESKDASLAWHYRLVDANLVEHKPGELLERLAALIRERNLPVEYLDGKMVIEIRLRGVHKGNIVEYLNTRGRTYDFQFAMGDDATDENLFTALPPGAFTMKVGTGATAARLRLPGVQQARDLLAAIVEENGG